MGPSKEKIKKEVVEQLYWDSRVEASEIEVEVRGNTVILKGVIPSYNAKNAASSDAWAINGVKEVDNQIEVKYPPSVTAPTDEQIESDIEKTLEINLDIDSKDIDVGAAAGIVQLDGTVDAYWKKTRAETIASGITGVLDIENNLKVVPTKSHDKKIAKEIIASLKRNVRVDADNVDVKVEGGKVTLSGTVFGRSAYRAVLNAAKFTSGVVEIEDNLIIENG